MPLHVYHLVRLSHAYVRPGERPDPWRTLARAGHGQGWTGCHEGSQPSRYQPSRSGNSWMGRGGSELGPRCACAGQTGTDWALIRERALSLLLQE